MSTADPRLGRLIQFDERSRSFPIRTLLEPKPLRSYTWGIARTVLPQLLDQGNTPACTGFSVIHEAVARPKQVPNLDWANAHDLYRRAKELDEWPGEDYDGSSVLAAVKAGQERGWYSEYRWAFSLKDALLAIGYRGPGILGCWWYEWMMEPDSEGWIRPTGSRLGGHAILVNGINVKRECVKLVNSWGESWGKSGTCLLSFEDFGKLLSDEGEFCIPVVRHL